MKEFNFDYYILFEPLIKNLEHIKRSDIKEKYHLGSVIVMTSNLEPNVKSIKATPSNPTFLEINHKTPAQYLSFVDQNRVGFILEESLDEVILGSEHSCSSLDLNDFKQNYIFDKNKFKYTARNQILELGQICSETAFELKKEHLIYIAQKIQEIYFISENRLFFENYGPQIRYYSDLNELKTQLPLKKLSLFQ